MNPRYRFLELAARCYVALLLSAYGLGKIIGGQFYRRGKLPPEVAEQTLASVNGYDLAWSFMGYSYTYICFIGGMQLLGSALLLFEKTKYVGILLLLPILTNIIIFDAIFFRPNDYGALASAMLYFSLLILVLVLNSEKSILLLKNLLAKGDEKYVLWNWKNLFSVLLTGLLIFMLDQIMIQYFGIL